MEIGFNLEIHFYSQKEGSVFLESNCSGNMEKFGEILLFNCYFLRQIVNFGNNHEIVNSILSVFMDLVLDLISITEHSDPDLPKLIKYKGTSGRKRFLAKLRFKDNHMKFNFKAKGFGLLARGIGYYSPSSIYLLLKYLVSKRIEDEEYIYNLSDSIKECIGTIINQNLNMMNQHKIALIIASKYYFNA